MRVFAAIPCLIALVAPSTAAGAGGPDAFGYEWDTATYDFVAITIGSTRHDLRDEVSAQVPLPFPFTFYGNVYNDITVHDDGAFRFGTHTDGNQDNFCLPWDGLDVPDVAPFWDDLRLGIQGGTGAAFTRHDSANGRFIISWEGVARWGATADPIDFQVHLIPPSRIEMHWADTDLSNSSYDHGASATIGIQDMTGGTNMLGNVLEVSCNTAVDRGGTAIYFDACAIDGDGDSFGPCDGDCDDTDPARFPGNPEVCNGVDDDCDLVPDSGLTFVDYWPDADGDGYGDEGASPVSTCDGPPAGHVTDNTDCDDGDGGVHPGAPELCDGVDSDCVPPADVGVFDLPGAGAGQQIPDFTTTIYDLTVPFNDPIVDVDVRVDITHQFDQDLVLSLRAPNGVTVVLADSRGANLNDYSVTLFDDEAATPIGAGSPPFNGSFQPEEPLSAFDGLGAGGTWQFIVQDQFNDQTGTLNSWAVIFRTEATDSDGDGFVSCADCDDSDASVNPGAAELCDQRDNDCDGDIDEGLGTDGDGDGHAAPDPGGCGGEDCDDDDPDTYPDAPELCDFIDNDCDGELPIDEADNDGDGYFGCEDDCNDFASFQNPGLLEDPCDDIDHDCDGDPTSGQTCGPADGGPGCDCESSIVPTAPTPVALLIPMAALLFRRRGAHERRTTPEH